MESGVDIAVDLIRNSFAFGRKFKESRAQFWIIEMRFAAALAQPLSLLAEIPRALPHPRNISHAPTPPKTPATLSV